MKYVKAHKHIRLPNGLLDLKTISKMWHEERGYDLKIKGSRKKSERLARHLRKEHPSTKGKMTVYDIKLWKEKLKNLRARKDMYLKHGSVQQYHDQIAEYKAALAKAYERAGKANVRPYDFDEWIKTEDPFRDPQTKHTWKKGTKYIRLKVMPFTRKWYIRLDNWDGSTDTVLKDQTLGKRESDAIKKAIEWQRAYDPAPKKSGKPKRWYEAMVQGIKKRSDVQNPYAIVNRIWGRLSPSKQAEIRRREAKGERFVYDLPLPKDVPTRGVGTVRTVKPFDLAEVQVNVSAKHYLDLVKSKLFSKMKRNDGSTALVKRCKSATDNVNVFIDKVT